MSQSEHRRGEPVYYDVGTMTSRAASTTTTIQVEPLVAKSRVQRLQAETVLLLSKLKQKARAHPENPRFKLLAPRSSG